jgi:prevent-host-death family protein
MKRAAKKVPGSSTVKASEFKAKCLDLMDRVAATGTSITVTKRGVPVARLVPIAAEPKSLRGLLRGQIEVVGDIVAPIDLAWDALR